MLVRMGYETLLPTSETQHDSSVILSWYSDAATAQTLLGIIRWLKTMCLGLMHQELEGPGSIPGVKWPTMPSTLSGL